MRTPSDAGRRRIAAMSAKFPFAKWINQSAVDEHLKDDYLLIIFEVVVWFIILFGLWLSLKAPLAFVS
jgi:hypothetical protein